MRYYMCRRRYGTTGDCVPALLALLQDLTQVSRFLISTMALRL